MELPCIIPISSGASNTHDQSKWRVSIWDGIETILWEDRNPGQVIKKGAPLCKLPTHLSCEGPSAPSVEDVLAPH